MGRRVTSPMGPDGTEKRFLIHMCLEEFYTTHPVTQWTLIGEVVPILVCTNYCLVHVKMLFKGYLTHLIKRSSVKVRIANVLVIIRKGSFSLILFSLVIETLQEGNPTVFRLGNQGLVWIYIHNGRSHEFCGCWELTS